MACGVNRPAAQCPPGGVVTGPPTRPAAGRAGQQPQKPQWPQDKKGKGKGKAKERLTPEQVKEKDNLRKERCGLEPHQLELLRKLDRRRLMDSTGFPGLDANLSAPLEPEKAAEFNRHMAALKALKAVEEQHQDHDLINSIQLKLDAAAGKQQTAAGEVREVGQLHNMMGSLKRFHASESELKLKAVDAAKAALKKATEALAEAEKEQEEEKDAYARRTTIISGYLDIYDDDDNDHHNGSDDSNDKGCIIDPTILSPVLSHMISKVRATHNVGDTLQMAAVSAFCSMLISELPGELREAAANLGTHNQPSPAGDRREADEGMPYDDSFDEDPEKDEDDDGLSGSSSKETGTGSGQNKGRDDFPEGW